MRALCRLALVAALAVANVAIASAQAMAQWNKTVHDFGLFHESDGDQTINFVVTNTGDSAMVFLRVQSTCGCTVAKYPTDPILPGKSSNIEVTYSPTGRPGPFEKAVWVYTNTKPNRTRLVIKGSVIGNSESVKRYYPVAAGDLQFTALTLPLGETKKGLMPSTSTTAYNTGNDTIVLSFDNNTSHITYDAIPDTIPPGQISTTTFFFDSNRTPVWGINDDYITIIATPLHSNYAASKIKVNIIANVVEDFSSITDDQRSKSPVCAVAPDKLMLPNLKTGELAYTELKVTNTGKSNMMIRRVMALDKALTTKSDKTLLKPGEEARVSIRVNPSKIEGKILNSQVTVITNDPVNPHITVRVVGEIN